MAEEKTKLNVITSLADFAAADAEHDFSSARAGGNLFANIFKKHKFIGTPTLPAKNTSTEYEILNKFLNIFDKNAPPPSPEQPAAFQAKFLKDGETFNFNRWKDDKDATGAPIGYTVKAKKVAIKGPRGREWTLSGKELYDWMNVKNTGVAFMIDAASVPFYELFTEEEGPTVETVYHVNGREGINDAAGKVVIDQKPKKTYKIKVQTVDDTFNEGIIYPTTLPLGRTNTTIKDVIDKVTDRELFYSNFSIFLSPIKAKGKVKSVNMEITTRDYTKQINLLKGQKEDAHPNAVSTLAKMIMSIFKGIFKDSKGTTNTDRTKYYSYLQQKRSGDWLQVLSTLDAGRFAVPKGCRIAMVTMDKICAAYQIAMGGDCIFTYAKTGDPTEYWLLYFSRGKAEDPAVVLQNDIAFTKESMNPDAKIFSFLADPGTYRDAVEAYGPIFRERIGAAENAVRGIIRGYRRPPRLANNLIETTTRDLLLAAVKLAVLHLHAQEIRDTSELAIFDEAPPENASSLLSKYKKNYIYIKSILSNVIKERVQAGNVPVSDAIKLFFNRIGRSNMNAEKDFDELINNLKIFGRLFTKGNGGKSGLGIFSFLNNSIPDGEIKSEIIAFFNDRLGELSTPSDKNAYSAFLATVRLLTDSATESDRQILIPERGMVGGNPSGGFDGISDKELLDILDSLHSERLEEVNVNKAIIDAENMIERELRHQPNRLGKHKKVGNTSGAYVEDREKVKEVKEGEGREEVKEEEEVEDIYEQIDPARIHDYQAAATILAERVNTTFAERGLQEGGGEPQRYHSPLVTYYLFLREISFRMSYEEEEFKALDAFANIIINTLTIVAKEPKEKQDAYFSALEIFFLEQIDTYEGLPEQLSASRHYIEQIMLSVKDGYYGFRHIPDAYIQPVDSIKEILESSMNITNASRSPDETIDSILRKMTNIIRFMSPLKRSKRKSKKNSNVNTTKRLHNGNSTNMKKMNKRFMNTKRIMKHTRRKLNKMPSAAAAVTVEAVAAPAAGGSRAASSLRSLRET